MARHWGWKLFFTIFLVLFTYPLSYSQNKPNLLITGSVTVDPSPVNPGNNLAVNYRLKNDGSGNAAQSITRVQIKNLSADFDGDGKTDVFHRPEDSHDWLVSYGGTGKWQTINTSKAKISEMGFGDFDGDGKTDVFHRPEDSHDWLVSYGGTGQFLKINESAAKISEMEFGDFDGDGKTDVFHAPHSSANFVADQDSLDQPFQNVRLMVNYYNNFREGYNSEGQSYTFDFNRTVTGNSKTRDLVVSVAKSFPTTTVKMTAPREDGFRCPDEEWILIPQQATAFVYTLKGEHPLLPNRTRVLDKVKKDLPGFQPTPNTVCVPTNVPPNMKRIWHSDSEVHLSAPISASEEAANIRAIKYTVQFDILGKDDSVIISREKDVMVPTRVPIIISIGDSYSSGEGNPDTPGQTDDTGCEEYTTQMMARGLSPTMKPEPIWLEKSVHRSLRSAPALAAEELLTEWPYVIFMSFAESGAKFNGESNEKNVLEQLRKVKEFFGDYKIDALVISAGGNDVGFANLLTRFATDIRRSAEIEHTNRIFETNLANLRRIGYSTMASYVSSLNVGHVLIVDYSSSLSKFFSLIKL